MSKSMHQLQRAMSEITLQAVQSTRERDARDYQMGLGEHEEQFQIPLTGTAGRTPGFAEIEIGFDHHFFYAPAQRDSDLDRPHFTFGSECAEPVIIQACVKEWNIRESNGAIRGATLRVSVMAAGTVAFEDAVLNVTFQGFAALDEVETEDLEI